MFFKARKYCQDSAKELHGLGARRVGPTLLAMMSNDGGPTDNNAPACLQKFGKIQANQ